MNQTITESERRQAAALARLDGKQPVEETTKPDYIAVAENGRPVANLVLAPGADATDAAAYAARSGWRVVTAEEHDGPMREALDRQRAAIAEITGSDAKSDAMQEGDVPRPTITVTRQSDAARFDQEMKATKRTLDAVEAKLGKLAGKPAKTGKPDSRKTGGEAVELREVSTIDESESRIVAALTGL